MLTSMFQNNFPTWIKTYDKKVKDNRKQKLPMLGNDETYDAIIQLLADSVIDNDENVELTKDTELIEPIVTILKNSSQDHDRYIPVLNLVACLANADKEIADEFIDNSVHTLIMTPIKKCMKIYDKNNYVSLFDENSKDTIGQ